MILSAIEILALAIAILAMAPFFILVRQHRRTGINEYLLLASFFFVGALDQVVFILTGVNEKLIYYQLLTFLFTLTFFLIFLHAIRIIWIEPPRLLLIVGYSWFLLILILTLFWSIEEQPDQTTFGFLTINHFDSGYHPKGAGFTIGGNPIYSSSFPHLNILFSIFTSSTILYVHLKMTPFHPTPKILKIRKLWIIAWTLLLLFSIGQFVTNSVHLVPEIFLFAGTILVFYIAAVMPEALVISHVQILRANQLYTQVKSIDQEFTVIGVRADLPEPLTAYISSIIAKGGLESD